MGELKIEMIPVDKLKPYERNAKRHENFDVDVIARSIQKFGFSDPIGIWSEDNVVVEGHGRLLAAKKLGLTEVPCIRLNFLTDEQRRAYAIVHNKSTELSEWDFQRMRDEVNSISFSLADFGFWTPRDSYADDSLDEDDEREQGMKRTKTMKRS